MFFNICKVTSEAGLYYQLHVKKKTSHIVDWPVGLGVRDPDCYARGRGFDSHPGQIVV